MGDTPGHIKPADLEAARNLHSRTNAAARLLFELNKCEASAKRITHSALHRQFRAVDQAIRSAVTRGASKSVMDAFREEFVSLLGPAVSADPLAQPEGDTDLHTQLSELRGLTRKHLPDAFMADGEIKTPSAEQGLQLKPSIPSMAPAPA